MKRADAERAFILANALEEIGDLPAELNKPVGETYDYRGLMLGAGDLTHGAGDWANGSCINLDAETGRILLELARNLIVSELKTLGVEP